jgi:eukaryotic-like serine/threonine-protein kinase
MPPVPAVDGDAASWANPRIGPGSGAGTEMPSNDEPGPVAPGTPLSSRAGTVPVHAAPVRETEPVTIGRFTLLEPLGEGPMGEFYAAYDEQLDRRVALKLVRQGSELTAKADELLQREARALARVSHPNIAQIYEAGTHEGRLFIAMELIRGQTLTRWLGETAAMLRPRRQREVLRRFIAAGRGLEAAHAAGVAHRDFKPDAVVVDDDGRVRVADFGLSRARVDDPAGSVAAGRATAAPCTTGPGSIRPMPSVRRPMAGTRPTEPGMVMRTLQFMAPEQIRGAIADHRSDQFSFCVALYHALYGVFPFAGEHMRELLDSMATQAIALEHSAGLAARVRHALRRGLSVDPSQRFASMGKLLEALEPSMRGKGGWIAGAVLLLVTVALAYLWSAATDPCVEQAHGPDPPWSAEVIPPTHTTR